MSINQLKSVKKLVISSGAKKYMAKTYEFAIIPKSGPASFIKCVGDKIPANVTNWFQKSQPGDMIMIANLVIFGLDKYEMVESPMWTVVANK